MSRGLGLLSGGLDSILAALVLRRAGVEVEAVSFTTPFFDAQKAGQASAAHDIPLTVLEVGREHLDKVVKEPRYGYGSNMNPCIDCHAYMLAKAGGLMAPGGYDFVFTGEVLGQRPMSQNKQSLRTVLKASGMAGKVLRPLSAKLLEPTPMEESGLVDREQLLDLQGRGRKRQIELARLLGVTDYPPPAGGCLLTEPGFSRRLKDLLGHQPNPRLAEVELLKLGRHFRLSNGAKLVVGRNQSENREMEQLSPPEAVRLITQGYPGPLGLYFGPDEPGGIELAASIVAGYGKAPEGKAVAVQKDGQGGVRVTALSRRLAHGMLI